jgi:hypothetical protein
MARKKLKNRTLVEKKAACIIYKKHILDKYKTQLDDEIVETLGNYKLILFTTIDNNNINQSMDESMEKLYIIKLTVGGTDYKLFIKDKVNAYIEEYYNYDVSTVHETFAKIGPAADKFKVNMSLEDIIKALYKATTTQKYSWMSKYYLETKSFIVMEDTTSLPTIDEDLDSIDQYSDQLTQIMTDLKDDILVPNLSLHKLRIRPNGKLVWGQSFDYCIFAKSLNFMFLPDDFKGKHVEYILDLDKPTSLNHLVQTKDKFKHLRDIRPSKSNGLLGYELRYIKPTPVAKLQDIFSIEGF